MNLFLDPGRNNKQYIAGALVHAEAVPLHNMPAGCGWYRAAEHFVGPMHLKLSHTVRAFFYHNRRGNCSS